ncbi:LytR C-terminal domain-containing protein [Rhodococcus maanshanensis]|uniref:LytR C-terminal domain-containing protein n=1 Tax=Rhodococcus maanshanensis TaxID=183556 RepID=UPI0022B5D30E|nr:LytR C-terminal domain-containing protein [Rhodococcus maanshanensis]MCZ4555015.1 LytR C-terminal domain-containing protein [Rhodococcus maanshanensis]
MSTPEQPPSGPPLRAFAMVLIALAIAFAGIGAMALSGNDSESDQPETTSSVARAAGNGAASVTSAKPPAAVTSARPPAAITSTTAAATTTTAPVLDKSAVSVRVLNNSTVSGLAAQTARTIESDGWTVGETGNYSDGSVSSTTVYYSASSPAEKAAATEIAATLGVSAEPRFPGITSASPGVIVIVTAP